MIGWKNENRWIRYIHLWNVESCNKLTTVSGIAILSGFAIPFLKPIVFEKWQRSFSINLESLIEYSNSSI